MSELNAGELLRVGGSQWNSYMVRRALCIGNGPALSSPGVAWGRIDESIASRPGRAMVGKSELRAKVYASAKKTRDRH